MALRDIVIETALTEGASELRQAEWETILVELLDPNECVFKDADVLRIARTNEAYALTLLLEDGSTHAACSVTHAELSKTFDEYIDIVRKLGHAGDAGGYDRVDALDMAKRVTHDQGGRIVLRACRALEVDHPTARRLFTLLLSLTFDTTDLDIQGHVNADGTRAGS